MTTPRKAAMELREVLTRALALLGELEAHEEARDRIAPIGDLIDKRRVAENRLLRRDHGELIYKSITDLHFINGKPYSKATKAEKNAWLEENADRVLFGGAFSNNRGNDHSLSLANVDDVAVDRLGPDIVSLAKRLAGEADPKIGEPEGGYVLLTGPHAFRDFISRQDVMHALLHAWPISENHPMFGGNTFRWDGVTVESMPQIESLGAVGGGGARVAPSFLCGVGGMVTIYTAAETDA